MKNNFPIQYAAMPLSEFDERNSFGYSINDSFVVSKCYVLREIIKHSFNGKIEKSFEVTFPYQIDYRNWARVNPEYNSWNNQYYNTTVVSNIFNSYEEASEYVNSQNEEIYHNKKGGVSGKNLVKEIDQMKQKYSRIKEIINNLANEFERRTPDLVINKFPKEQSIIVANAGNFDIIINESIYQYIECRYKFMSRLFYACNVSQETYDCMKEQIETNRMLNERNSQFTNPGYEMSRYLLASDINNPILKIINCDSKEEIGCFYLSDGEMYYDKNMLRFDKDPSFKEYNNVNKIYTTETYGDIISSYISNYQVDASSYDNDIENVVTRKSFVLKHN